MFAIVRVVSTIAFLFYAAVFALSQELKEGTGSVSGRITVKGAPLPGVTVTLTPYGGLYQPQQFSSTKAKTDEDGRYKLTGLDMGRYLISAFTPTLVAPPNALALPGNKPISVGDGEEIEGIDFELLPGGIVTGRVTDSQGRPLINERVTIHRLDEQNHRQPLYLPNYHMFQTDDRGWYRLYGIPPGRYLLSAGVDLSRGTMRMGFGSSFYPLAFHPDAADESLARAFDVTSGGETAGIDIVVGRPSKSYSATGRVIYADTGKPVVAVFCGCGPLSPDGKRMMGMSIGYHADSEGNVRLQGLMPGRYGAFCQSEGEGSYYSETTVFEIKDSDISGIEIRIHTGGSINGQAAIEGTDDPAILAKLVRLQIYAYVQSDKLNAPRMGGITIQPDGSFHIGGLSPGKARISFSPFSLNNKGFHLIRVEREGIDQSKGIEIKAGETISGVQIAFAYGNSRIRGQVNLQGGGLPGDIHCNITARRKGENPLQPTFPIETDDRGRFLIEGLMAGEYELIVTSLRIAPGPKIPPVRQIVTVTGYEDAEVTINIDLSAKDKDGQR